MHLQSFHKIMTEFKQHSQDYECNTCKKKTHENVQILSTRIISHLHIHVF